MSKNYSRFAKLEERKSVRSAVMFGGLTILVVIFALVFGIPLVTHYAGVVTDLKESNQPVENNDKTPPPPPNFNNLPDFSNQSKLTVTGNTEAGAVVNIYFNDVKNEVISDTNGDFSSDFNLNDGDNTVYAISVDKAGNKSGESSHIKIVFDNKPPKLNLTSPHDGDTVYNKGLDIKGQTEIGASLTINGRYVSVDEKGEFKFSTQLSSGDNNFDIKAQDKAGNVTSQTIKVKLQ